MSFLIRPDKTKSKESITASLDADSVASLPVEPDEKLPPLPAASSSVIKFYPNWCTCFDHTLSYPRPENASCKENCRFFFRCPPGGPVAKVIVFLTIFILTWVILWLLIGNIAGTNGPILAIFVLEIVGLFLGILVKAIGIPTLLAPLALGILLRNVESLDIFEYFQYPYHTLRHSLETGKLLPYCTSVLNYNISYDLEGLKCCNHFKLVASSNWITPIREIALTLILTRAGLELSPKQLKKLKGVVPALAFIPCCVEATTCGALFYWSFIELSPSVWICAVAGFALSAVSPAVVVPGVLSLSKKGYGVAKGIPTLLIAASSIDDVLAITLYTIALSLSTSGKPSKLDKCYNPYAEVHAPVEYPSYVQIVASLFAILLGLVVGVIMGCILHFIPSPESNSKGAQRLILLLVCNIACMLGFARTEIVSGAGSIGVLTTSFIASFGWRSQRHWKPAMKEVEHKLTHIWTIFVPILFGTIGKEIKFALENGMNDPYDVDVPQNDTVNARLKEKYFNPFALGIIFRIIGIILASLLARCLATAIIAYVAGFNCKERLFVALAWIPKATVQAALAPLVLSTIVDKEHTVRMTSLAKAIVTMAVFSIMITAPIGAICITFAGPHLLTKISEAEVEEEFPNGDDELLVEESVDLFKSSEARLKSFSSGTRESFVTITENLQASNLSVQSLGSSEGGSILHLNPKLRARPRKQLLQPEQSQEEPPPPESQQRQPSLEQRQQRQSSLEQPEPTVPPKK